MMDMLLTVRKHVCDRLSAKIRAVEADGCEFDVQIGQAFKDLVHEMCLDVAKLRSKPQEHPE